MGDLDNKLQEMLDKYPHVWKSKSSFMSWIRGGVRGGLWNRHPIKLELLKKRKKQIPNPNYGKPRNTKPNVIGMSCEVCNKDFPQKEIQVDHKHGGNYSLTTVSDIQQFIESIILVTEDDLRLVCKGCHTILSYSAKEGVSFEEAKVRKRFIQIKKDGIVDVELKKRTDNFPKTKKARDELLLKLMLEDLE